MTPDDTPTVRIRYVPCGCNANPRCPRCRGFGELLVPVRPGKRAA